eukprot:NODE_658_length_5456_cov_0.429158.p1 type:complete len:281 gc:universal NODE_658_length_5456_cov_0.429158:2497-3339(+)
MLLSEDLYLYLINSEFELAYKLSHSSASYLREKYPVIIQIKGSSESVTIQYLDGWRLNNKRISLGALKDELNNCNCPLASCVEFVFEGGTLLVGHVSDDWVDEILHLYIMFNGKLEMFNHKMKIQLGYYQLVKNESKMDLLIGGCRIIKDVLASDFSKYIERGKYKITADSRLLTQVKRLSEGWDILVKYDQIDSNPTKYVIVNGHYMFYYDTNWHFKRNGDVYWIKCNSKPCLLWRFISYVFSVEYVYDGEHEMQEDQHGRSLDDLIVRYLFLINNNIF